MKKIILGLVAVVTVILVTAFSASGYARAATTAPSKPMAVAAQQIPVLCFHNIGKPSPAVGSTDYYSVTLANFKAEMAWLHQQGYHTITPAQYANWVAGVNQVLPAKPVLLTFDDLFTADLTQATPVLQQYGFSAVGFVVTGYADGAYLNIDNGTNTPHRGANAYALWSSIKSYAAGGTWTFQLHAGLCGHAYMPYAPPSCLTGLDQATMSDNAFQYYIWNFGQTDAQYQARVTAETTAGLTDMGSHLGTGFQSLLFAAPFGAWGNGDNPWLLSYWDSTYNLIFVQYIAAADESVAHANKVRFRLELAYGAQSASYLSSHISNTAFTQSGSGGSVGNIVSGTSAGQ